MNHRTPAEDFRATLAALTREQLEEAMHYLRARDPRAMDRALELAATPVGAAAHGHDDADLPWTSGAHQFIPCTTCTADACNACSRPAGDAAHRIAGDFGAEQVTEPARPRLLSCGHLPDASGGCDCASWPETACARARKHTRETGHRTDVTHDRVTTYERRSQS